MRYDFDQVVDRSKNLSAKYDERVKKFGTDDVIPLWIADMDFKTAQPIIDALKARAEEGIWGYTARPASYFEAVKNWQKRRNGWETDTALMSFCPGVVQTLSVMIQLYTPQGGNVLIQTPVYGEFYDMAEFAGRHVIENQLVEQDGKWTVDWADFEEKLHSADIFLLCNPHNPLGIVWTEEELRQMMELCLKYHVLVVATKFTPTSFSMARSTFLRLLCPPRSPPTWSPASPQPRPSTWRDCRPAPWCSPTAI